MTSGYGNNSQGKPGKPRSEESIDRSESNRADSECRDSIQEMTLWQSAAEDKSRNKGRCQRKRQRCEDLPTKASVGSLEKRGNVEVRLYSVSETATVLSISERTCWRLLAAGDLKRVRIGRCVRITSESVNRLIKCGGIL